MVHHHESHESDESIKNQPDSITALAAHVHCFHSSDSCDSWFQSILASGKQSPFAACECGGALFVTELLQSEVLSKCLLNCAKVCDATTRQTEKTTDVNPVGSELSFQLCV